MMTATPSGIPVRQHVIILLYSRILKITGSSDTMTMLEEE